MPDNNADTLLKASFHAMKAMSLLLGVDKTLLLCKMIEDDLGQTPEVATVEAPIAPGIVSPFNESGGPGALTASVTAKPNFNEGSKKDRVERLLTHAPHLTPIEVSRLIGCSPNYVYAVKQRMKKH